MSPSCFSPVRTTLCSRVCHGQAFQDLLHQLSVKLWSYNAKMLLHFLSLLPVVEADPLSHSPSTSFCREKSDAPFVTGSDVSSEVDDNESPVDVPDPASPLFLNDSWVWC